MSISTERRQTACIAWISTQAEGVRFAFKHDDIDCDDSVLPVHDQALTQTRKLFNKTVK